MVEEYSDVLGSKKIEVYINDFGTKRAKEENIFIPSILFKI